MQKEDWIRVAKWTMWVNLPIVILVVFIFILVEWNAHRLDTLRAVVEKDVQVSTTTADHLGSESAI
jgi:hypothetical protein